MTFVKATPMGRAYSCTGLVTERACFGWAAASDDMTWPTSPPPLRHNNRMRAETKLLFIKAIHTVVWGFFVAVIGYVLYCGIANRISGGTWVASGLVVGEGVVLLAVKRHCPLTLLARNYSTSNQDNFDIFLPNWLAHHNQLIFTSIYGFALLLLGYRLVQTHY